MDKLNSKDNLEIQLKKTAKSTNEGSYGTRDRYLEGAKRAYRYIAEKYNQQKIQNLRGKHLHDLVDHMKAEGYAPATIRTDLSGIRFMYKKAGGTNRLPTNKELGVPKGERGTIDRAWSDTEVKKAIDTADKMGRSDVSLAIRVGRAFGFRLNEVCTIRVEHIEKAMTQTGGLRVLGKGGKYRSLPIKTDEQRDAVRKLYDYARNNHLQKGDFIISENKYRGVEAQKKSIQSWICNHRDKFMDKNRAAVIEPGKKRKTERISFHGLRYDFAQEKKANLDKEGVKNSEKEVSQSLGHNRVSITRHYLADVPVKKNKE